MIETKKISLPVEGMTCASCVARVEKTVAKVEGIKNVSVNLATEKVSFDYDPKLVDLKDVAARIAYVINNPRDFIHCNGFFGPERRRRVDLQYSGPFRRRSDNSSMNTENTHYDIPK